MPTSTVPKAEERPTISVEEAAVILGIGRATAYRCVNSGEIPSVRFGTRVRVPTAALRQLLKLYG